MKGKCLIFSAPSGSGKTTIVKRLMATMPEQLAFSISATSRQPRKGEKDGVDYHFLSAEEFEARVAQDDFVEWEEVYPGTSYGTLKAEVERIWASGKSVLFDVDVVGGLNLKRYFAEQALAIFINPPSIAELEKRLRKRGTETEEKIAMRIGKAEQELAQKDGFDLIIQNDNLEVAVDETVKQVRAFIS